MQRGFSVPCFLCAEYKSGVLLLVGRPAPGPLKNTTKIPREDPQEREERKKIVAGEGKNAKF